MECIIAIDTRRANTLLGRYLADGFVTHLGGFRLCGVAKEGEVHFIGLQKRRDVVLDTLFEACDM